MPRYDYRCPNGHTIEAIFPIGQALKSVLCTHCPEPEKASRVFSPPAAILFHGPGFYSTDVKKRLNARRRKNPGDDLPKEFDHAAAKIAAAI